MNLFPLLLVSFCIVASNAQTSFTRVFFVATGEPATYSYFDYVPATSTVARIQTINDAAFLAGDRNTASVTISALASDNFTTFGLLTVFVKPALVTKLINMDQLTCQLSQIILPFSTGLGLAIDPVDKLIYWNYQNPGNVTTTLGINRMSYDGTNLTSVFVYPSTPSNWLAVDINRQKIYTTSNTTFEALTITKNSTTNSVYHTPTLGGAIDQTTGKLYYPDPIGILSFDPTANVTTRTLTITNNRAKSLALDYQNGLIFIQMYPVSGQFVDAIYVVSVNLNTAIANPATLKMVPGLLATDNNAGNLISVSYCTNATCSVCGFQFVLPPVNPTGPLNGANVHCISMVLLAALLFILL